MIPDSPASLPAVSVVVPCRDAEKTIDTQIEALTGQDYEGPLEVIVVDNGSTDGSRAAAGRWPGVKVLSAPDHPGPNHARNAGARAATGELILTCDADDAAAAGWVSAMAQALSEFDLVGGSLDYTLLNVESQRWPTSRDGSPARYGFLPTAIGANFGIRASTLEALGGWDESFDGGPDDTELCWRAQLAGYRLGSAPEAIVHYRLRSTSSALARQAFDGGRRIPHLARRFRGRGMSYRGLFVRAAQFGGYIVLAAPAALVSKRVRMEWIRRIALAAGFGRGLITRDTESVIDPR